MNSDFPFPKQIVNLSGNSSKIREIYRNYSVLCTATVFYINHTCSHSNLPTLKLYFYQANVCDEFINLVPCLPFVSNEFTYMYNPQNCIYSCILYQQIKYCMYICRNNLCSVTKRHVYYNTLAIH